MSNNKSKNQAIVNELKTVGEIASGYLGSFFLGKTLNKALKVDDSIPGFQLKKLIVPGVQTVGGIVGSIKLTNPILKNISLGVAASGAVNSVNLVLNKNILSGVSGFGSPKSLATSVYQDSKKLPVGKYNPDLPHLTTGSNRYEEEPAMVYRNADPEVEVFDADFEFV